MNWIKYLLLYALGFACVLASNSQSLDSIVVKEFSKGAQGWKLKNEKDRNMYLNGGAYYIETKSNFKNWICYSYGFIKNQPFQIDIRIKLVKGTGGGFVFDYFNNKNFHELMIKSNGAAELNHIVDGSADTLLISKMFFEDPNSWQNISIRYNIGIENGLHIYANNKKLYVDEKFTANQGRFIGPIALPKATVATKYIYLLQDKGEIELADNTLTAEDYEVVKLPNTINTEKYSESAPVISPDGSRLYVIRRSHPDNKGGVNDNDDAWYSDKLPDGTWSELVNAPDSLNITNNSWVVSVSADNNSLVMANVPTSKKMNKSKGGISQSTKLPDGKWSLPTEIKIKNAGSTSKWVNYYLSPNGKYLFMSAKKDNYFSNDLYLFIKDDSGNWSDTINLGPDINTSLSEAKPFLAPDNKTLYFSSDGHPGYGSYDMFKTTRLDDTWQKWSKPVNLGPHINTENKDYGITLTASGDFGYMVRYNSNGLGDIYSFRLPQSSRPEAVLIIQGRTLDSETSQPISASVVYNDMESGEELGSGTSDPNTGEYKIILPIGSSYGISAEKTGYYSITESAKPATTDSSQTITKDLYMQPVAVNKTLRLNNLFFDTGEFKLKPESKNELDKVITLIEDNPEFSFIVEGHTDDVGSDENNMKLSEDRAKAVMDYLVVSGIGATRLTSKGYGEDVPAKPNDSDENRQFNRRVELRVNGK
jgi:outer membrane protein OmpA-like peptidoglycan-associated protein